MLIKYLRRPRPVQTGPVFLLDLDNTLHCASVSIFPEIHRQMTQYVSRSLQLDHDQADDLRARYWLKYGATLLGMMKHHSTDPHHFLYHTHLFDDLRSHGVRPGSVPGQLNRLRGLRVVLTNAPRQYAVDLIKVLGFYGSIDAVVAIEDMVIHQRWRPKPSSWLWPRLQKQLRKKTIVLVDDTREHLRSAARRGIKGVWMTLPSLRYRAYARSGPVPLRIKCLSRLHCYGSRG